MPFAWYRLGMEEIDQTKRLYAEFVRSTTVCLLGAFIGMFQLAWDPLIVGPDAPGLPSWLSVLLGFLPLPILFLGVWLIGRIWRRDDFSTWGQRQKRALETDPGYKAALRRSRRTMIVCIGVGVSLTLAIYIWRHPFSDFTASVFIRALLLGVIGGQLVTGIIYLFINPAPREI